MALDMSQVRRAKQIARENDVHPPTQEARATSPAEIQEAFAARDRAIKLVMAAFGAAIPGHAHVSGHYEAAGEHFGAPSILIPDGKYRVIGADWAGRFEGGRLVEAFRCVPPYFGGDDIEIIS